MDWYLPREPLVFAASTRIGRGEGAWVRASSDVLTWAVKTRSGFAVDDVRPVEVGRRVIVTARVGPLRVKEPVEVTEVIDEPTRVGFTYRTLPGHPVSGEESFIVERRSDEVFLALRSRTSPAPRGGWRWIFPLLRIAQRIVRRRYAVALREVR